MKISRAEKKRWQERLEEKLANYNPSKKKLAVWMDIKHLDSGEMVVGLECDDPRLTFDGHYICLFPCRASEGKDWTGADERCKAVMDYMKGKKQAR